MKFLVLIAVCLFLIAGCANGQIYWTRGDATPDVFQTDHWPCFNAAYIGYGVGSEAAYKACMVSKGWTRVQGTGTQLPSVPYFRGPEGDDEFRATSTDTVALDEQCRRWRDGLDRHRQPPTCR
jgi:hypothetical protein